MKAKIVSSGLVGVFLGLLLFASPAAAASGNQDYYSREQLTQMLAPVALYPDALLSQVLMAATYPLEVVEADRFVRRNPLLSGENLDLALRDRDWDASVKALCQVPTVLALMSERLDETTNLGNAFLAQESEVMGTIQDLRARAYREGNLRSDDKQKVTVLSDGTIVIAPADPQTVYIPYYNTRVVYGPWWYPAWPPWYWGPGGTIVGGGGIYFWPDVYFGFSYGFGYWSYFDWPRRTIVIEVKRRPRFFRPDYDWRSRQGGWRHDPRHRRGVVYRDRPTAERFGQFRPRRQVDERKVRGFAGPDRAGRSPAVTRTTPADRKGEEETRPVPAPGARGEDEGWSGAGSGERSRVRTGEDGRLVEPPAPAERSRVAPAGSRPVQERRRETVQRSEPAGERERTTIFGGEENAREESRSSIRGRGSRDSMQRNESGRGSSSSPDRREDRGSDRGRFRR
jgi:hypothetical protein